MSALVINGITIPTLDNSSRDIINLGGTERAESGKVRSFERGTYYEHRFTTPPLSMANAELYKALIRGDGHTLSFDSTFTATSFLWTSRGIAASRDDGATRSPAAVYGGGSMLSGAGVTVEWTIVEPTWTVFGFFTDGLAPYEHWMATSDGRRYTSGLPTSDTHADIFSVTGSKLRLGSDDEVVLFDDVVVLPYDVPAAWVPSLYAFHSAQAWSPLKYVYASGARISGTKKMMGVIESVTDVEFGDSTGYHQGEQVTFLLKESP